MNLLPNRRPKIPLDRDRRNGRSWGQRLEVAVLIVLVCAASALVYVLLRTLCCGR